MLKASGHHHPYRCFENYNYQFSNANDKDGTMVFLCNRAHHPNGKDEWISNTSAWYRSRNKEAKTKPELKNLNIKDFCCTARLLVKVDISSNRDFASLTHPHECGGGIGNNAAAGDGGGEGGGIDDAQETADAHAVADVVGGGDEIIVDTGRNNAAAAQDPPAPALPNVNDNDNGIDNNGNDNGNGGGEAFLLEELTTNDDSNKGTVSPPTLLAYLLGEEAKWPTISPLLACLVVTPNSPCLHAW